MQMISLSRQSHKFIHLTLSIRLEKENIKKRYKSRQSLRTIGWHLKKHINIILLAGTLEKIVILLETYILRPGAGAPLTNHFGDINARRNRDADNAIYNTDIYSSYNNYQAMNQNPPTFRSNTQMSEYPKNHFATVGNRILDNTQDLNAFEPLNDLKRTMPGRQGVQHSIELQDLRQNMHQTGLSNSLPTNLNNISYDPSLATHQVPGIGIGYINRDQHFWQKKLVTSDDLANTLKQQMEEKKRREREEKLKREAEEREVEEKVKRELQQMSLEVQKEKERVEENSRVHKSFEVLNKEMEVDNEGRKMKRKYPAIKSIQFHGKEESFEKADSLNQSYLQHQSHYDHNQFSKAPILEVQQEEEEKSRVLNESVFDHQKAAISKVEIKLSSFYHQQYNTPFYPEGTELPITIKTAADERHYRLKKDLATRTDALREQATLLKVYILQKSQISFLLLLG